LQELIKMIVAMERWGVHLEEMSDAEEPTDEAQP
jgi:hypothetical protein